VLFAGKVERRKGFHEAFLQPHRDG